jgi:hypothetical protein
LVPKLSTPYHNYGDVLDSAHPELVEGSSLFRPRRSQEERCFDKHVLSTVEGLSMSGWGASEYVIELPDPGTIESRVI